MAVSLVLWAGAEQQRTVVDWHHLTDASSSHAFAAAIDERLRIDPEFFGKTAIGSAMYFALKALDSNAYGGVRRKIDVSGDGHANEGFKPEPVRDLAVLSASPSTASRSSTTSRISRSITVPTSSAGLAPSLWWPPTIETSSRRSA